MAKWSKTNVIEITENRRIDSEFFHPDYIDAENRVNQCEKVVSLGHIGKFIIGPFGSAFHVSNYDPNSEYRYVRGKDVKPFTLLDDDNVYMPEKDFTRLSRYALQQDDLLISVVGTLGNVAIVPEDVKGIFSCKSTVFRESKINPYYLLAYFNSKYGKQCLLRRQRGAIQMGLNKEDLKTVPVPIFDDAIQKRIGEKVFDSLKLKENSKQLRKKSKLLLENKLGLNSVNFNEVKSFRTSFFEVVNSSKMSSYFFQPKYEQLSKLLEQFETEKLQNLIKSYSTGFAFAKSHLQKSPTSAKLIKIGNIREMNIDLNSTDFVNDSGLVFGRNEKAKVGNILIGMSGSVGVSALIREETNAYINQRILRLEINEKIDPEYLGVVINSIVGSFQFEKYGTGGVQVNISPRDMLNITIPRLGDVEDEISKFSLESYLKDKESKVVLLEAIAEVESFIEQSNNN